MSEVKVLMIGEKPLISSTIAGILSHGKVHKIDMWEIDF